MKKDEEQKLAVVKITDAAITQTHQLFAYITGPGGNIVESVPIKENMAKLTKSKEEIEGQHRIYIAAQLPKELEKKANEKMLIKGGAYQVVGNFSDNIINVAKIPAGVIKKWFWGNCLITGTVTNTIIVDGQEKIVPVCDARVHLVEVEVGWRYTYPPVIVKKIPDSILSEIAHNFREIFPPIPHPDPIGPIALTKKPLVKMASLNAGDFEKLKSLTPLPPHVLQGITSTSTDTIKKTIVDYHDLLRPYFCYWPQYWYWIYEMDEDNVAYTDCNGRFEYWENTLTEDGPLNIYAWVEAKIGGVWTTVYKPSLVPCSTWWNYPCNTPININLRNPHILPCTCNVLKGDIVWIKSVGSSTSVRTIALNKTDAGKPSLFADARGLTRTGAGVGQDKWVSPFSGSFPIIVQFGDGFPSATAKYFRWKYRRIADADLNPLSSLQYKYQDSPLSKEYDFQGLDINGNLVWYSTSFQLDTFLNGTRAYKIPHADASLDVPNTQLNARWNQATTTININASTDLSNGVYEFVLELLDEKGYVVDVGINVFEIDSLQSYPNPASTPAHGVDTGYTIPYIPIPPPVGATASGFRFLLRIDNDHTTCSIDNAIVLNADGTTATTDTACGFAEYKDKATGSILLRFAARQPHRYADFGFSVIRGNGNVTVSVNGEVPESHITVNTAGGPVDCQINPSLASMLGDCVRGAFGETLWVRAYHTNGSERLDGYDSSAKAAFAITPERGK